MIKLRNSRFRDVFRAFVIVSSIAVASEAGAQTVSPPSSVSAADINRRWDRANTLYERGDYNAALVEYLEVYKHKPLPVVRYNLGRTEEKLGHVVEALDWLEKCLQDPGTLDETRREFARKMVDDLKTRIGTLRVTTNITGALVAIDHRDVGVAPQKIQVASGVHFVSVEAPGYAAQRKEVKVAGGIEESVHVELSPTTIATARLTISSDHIDAEVFVDGKSVGKTPILGSIKVEAIEHKIEVRRKGYKPFERVMKFTEGDTLSVAVKLEEDIPWIAANGGYLQLDLSEEHAVVNVSGVSRGEYRGSLRLAPGKHQLRVERAGFAAVEREVMVIAGKTTREKVVFEPNPDTLVKLREAYATRRKWGIAATSTGVMGFVVSGLAMIAIDRSYQLDECGTPGQKPLCTNYPGWKGVAGGFMGLGIVTTGVGVWLLSSRLDIHRYEKKPLKPVLGVSVGCFNLGVAGAF